MRRNQALIPLVLLGILAGLAYFMLPRLEEKNPQTLKEDNIRADSLREDRHYGYFQVDSIARWVRVLDPGGGLCQLVPEVGQLSFLKGPKADTRKFERVFFNKRSWDNMASLKNLPIELINEGGQFGFAAPVKEIQGEKFVLLPHGVVMGMLQAGSGQP